MQFLVDNLFIGDKLTRNQLQSHDGTTFDVRNITSPIIVFTSTGDNISPPPQTLGWILDLYRDVDDIRATGRTIVYCLNQKIGHLALFVSAKVGAKEDEEFVQLMDVIDCLPPGLYEMVISPRPADVPAGGFVTGDWIARFEARSLDDIRALGRNSPEDDRAFAAVARLSELNLSIYRTFMQPLVRALANQPAADLRRTPEPAPAQLHDVRRQQPLDEGRAAAGCRRGGSRASRWRPTIRSSRCSRRSRTRSLRPWMPIASRATRLAEQMFFGFYGSPFVQALLGINDGQRGAAVARHFARKAGGTTGPGGRVRGEAGDRRVRRSADPGGALRHRGRADARPALCTRVERRAPEAHASVARRVQGAGAGSVLRAAARA